MNKGKKKRPKLDIHDWTMTTSAASTTKSIVGGRQGSCRRAGRQAQIPRHCNDETAPPAVAQMTIVDAVARMNCEPALDTDER